ncbi:hypothetical protein PHMEG_00038341 [Phytophthora megakarya]|uniref:Uncharacterized protein n=1 Tax=Phytophthora megakarya TaxID=4795 RepID=A0A225UJ36_9STRA|nr:hypothetical protein PHMEG_00038341 [Phytophthora megakarya]
MSSRKLAEPTETQGWFVVGNAHRDSKELTFLTDDSVLFKKIWRVLRRKGWTAKPPPLRSLDCRFRYAKPGCSVDGDK